MSQADRRRRPQGSDGGRRSLRGEIRARREEVIEKGMNERNAMKRGRRFGSRWRVEIGTPHLKIPFGDPLSIPAQPQTHTHRRAQGDR